MAKAITERFEQMVLEVEGETPGDFARLCGLVDVEITRTNNVQTSEVPDCEDESKPHYIERETISTEVTVSASGVWSQSSSETMLDWFYSGATKVIRLGHKNAAPGDTEYETGPALLTSLGHSRAKGRKVNASINLEFDGTPTRTAKAAP